MLELRVTTRETLVPSSRAVPNIAIAAGLGPPFDPTRAPLATGRTDPDGCATLELPWSAVEAARAGNHPLWLRVTEPGYQQNTRALRLPNASGARDYVLIAYRGCTLRGRVLDAERRPVAADVRVTQGVGEHGLRSVALGQAGADGWFEACPWAPGTLHVLADAGERGSAALHGLVVGTERVPEPIELVVRGSGIVRGRVHDGTGRPTAGLDLEVVTAEYDRARDEPPALNALPGARRLGELELEGRGRVRAEVQTDAAGTFEARGLRDDLFVVRLRLRRGGEVGAALTPAPVRSDGTPLDLVHARTSIAVHVVDERGQPWPGAGAVHDPSPYRPQDSWPDDVRVGALATAFRPDPLAGMPLWLAGKRVATGEFVFEVRGGDRYLVGLLGGLQPWTPVEVLVPEGAGRVDVRLTPAAPAPKGTLLVDVVAPDGQHTSDVALRIEDLRTGLALVDRSRLYDVGWPQGFSLPEGNYRVVVDSTASVDGMEGEVFSLRSAGRFEAEARVVRDQSALMSGVLPAGARLKVRVDGAAAEADRAAIRTTYAGMTVGWPDWQELFAARVQLFLRADGRWPIQVDFVESWYGSADMQHLTPYLALGKEDVSQIVPSGRFTLEAHLPGGRVARAPVTLVDGQTTEVALAFE